MMMRITPSELTGQRCLVMLCSRRTCQSIGDRNGHCVRNAGHGVAVSPTRYRARVYRPETPEGRRFSTPFPMYRVARIRQKRRQLFVGIRTQMRSATYAGPDAVFGDGYCFVMVEGRKAIGENDKTNIIRTQNKNRRHTNENTNKRRGRRWNAN